MSERNDVFWKTVTDRIYQGGFIKKATVTSVQEQIHARVISKIAAITVKATLSDV